MNSTWGPSGTIDVAVSRAARLLDQDPRAAAEEAQQILNAAPDHAMGEFILAAAQRRLGRLEDAIQRLQSLTQKHAFWASAFVELAAVQVALGDSVAAIASLRAALNIQPDSPDVWRALADQLHARGDLAVADQAYLNFVRHSSRDPRLMALGSALAMQRVSEAESLAREQLKRHPTDVVAMRALAEIAGRSLRYADAENLLTRCLELAPSFHAARHHYALMLHRQNKSAAALEQLERVLRAEPDNFIYNNLFAAVLAGLGEYARSIAVYETMLAKQPRHAKIWLSYGHALKTAGRHAESVRAYRKAIEIAPTSGEAWWSLANMKTVRFGEHDIHAIRKFLAQGLSDEDRWHFEFALGKAFEDGKDFAESFDHYVRGNRLRRSQIGYRAQDNRAYVERCRKLFTREFFAERAGFGCDASDPIFIVGLPRSGSTLVEQVLASHSRVEGTMELPQLAETARALGGTSQDEGSSIYPEMLSELTAQQCCELGEQYLAETRIYRKTGSPFFIDKLPNNWAHVGLIQLLLPNAKIVDVRRHPLGCCFSAFKQHFARGQHFTYDLADVGGYYRDYVCLMAHFDAVLPGRVHRVIYERLVERFEAEVRSLLDYCGLPFEEACLRFYENDRAVRTASSEQVRRPIFKEAVEHWRNYEAWLDPLKASLGSVLDTYPQVPDDLR